MHGPRVEPTNRSVLPAACALPWAGCLSVPPPNKFGIVPGLRYLWRCLRQAAVRKCSNKFGTPLTLHYLCPMTVIRLTKEFSFEAAHALDGYDGPCREIHGHSYRLFVTVKGTPAEDEADPKCGMVMDFGVLKRIVNEEIVSRFDHALVLRGSASGAELRRVLAERFGNILTVDYQPTCENMLADFARRIAARLPEGVALHSLKLHETATSFAEWFAGDNE